MGKSSVEEKTMMIIVVRLERPLESKPVKISHKDSKSCFMAMPTKSIAAKDNILSRLFNIFNHV
ncbi:MAG: hypothetical protein QXR97_03990 [Thermoproteota archaeon]